MDRAKFFDVVRKAFGPLNQQQVQGFEFLIDEGIAFKAQTNQLAYVLSTAWVETAYTMQPIAEYGKGKNRPYGVPTKYGKQVAYGRGYVQLTWDYNYEKADKALVLNGALLKNFDLALNPEIAKRIIFEGMWGGWFTGLPLPKYIDEKKALKDYVNARRVVNGTDRAQEMAGYAMTFENALRTANYSTIITTPAPQPTPPAPKPTEPVVVPPKQPPADKRPSIQMVMLIITAVGLAIAAFFGLR